MTRLNQYPNCRRKSTRGFSGQSGTDVYECQQCGTVVCYRNCGSRCPDCGSRDKRKVGYYPSN